MKYTVMQNTTFFTVASIAQKLIAFLYFAIIARSIGAENTGLYFFAIAFTAIFIVFADFGLAISYTREAAKNKGKAIDYLNSILTLKLIFGVVAYIFVIIVVNLLNYPSITKNLVYIAGITMIFDNLHNIFYALFRSQQNLFFESLAIVGSQLFTLIIGVFAIFHNLPLHWLILAYTIPSFFNLGYSAYIANILFNFHFRLQFNKDIIKKFLRIAWPFAIAGIVMRLYAYNDSILISKLLNPSDLGLWGVSYKMATSFYFIAIALSSSVYPVFSGLFLNDKASIGRLFEKCYRYLFFLAFPIVGGIIVLARPTIALVYSSQYIDSVIPLQITISAVVFVFVSYLNGTLLNAIGKQKLQTLLLTVALVLSIIFNIIFIPKLGIIGAAITFLVTSVWLSKIGYYFISRYIEIDNRKIFKYCNQTFWPAVVMSICVHYLATQIYFIWTIPVGVIVYMTLVYIVGGYRIMTFINVKNKLINKF